MDIPARPPADWPARAARYLFSTAAVEIGINLASNHGCPALTAVTGLAAVLGVAGWLRRYPGSLLQRTARLIL